MTWPDGRGRADDDAPTEVIPPLRDEPDGIPGLHYMPGSPTVLPGRHRPGNHPRRGDRSRRPWPWLAALATLAVLAVLGVAWTIGGATDPPPRTASTAPTLPDTVPTEAATGPEFTVEPLPTTPQAGSSWTPPPTLSPSVTTAPPPSSTARRGLVPVPGVVGERRTGAQLELQRAGFEVSVRTVPVDSRQQDRRVVAQLPPAGTPVPAGSTVVLLVGER